MVRFLNSDIIRETPIPNLYYLLYVMLLLFQARMRIRFATMSGILVGTLNLDNSMMQPKIRKFLENFYGTGMILL